MHPVFRSALREVTAELGTFDATSAGVHPYGRPHCWSVQQIVEHLVLSLDATRTMLEDRLLKGRPGRNLHRTRTEWALQLMILSAGHMPKGVGAPRETTPAANLTSTGVRELTERLEQRWNCLTRHWTSAGSNLAWTAWAGISCWGRCASTNGAVTICCTCGTM